MLSPSKHNVISRFRNSDNYFIVNSLSGHADILSPEEYAAYSSLRIDDPTDWRDKGYLVEPADEEKRYREAYLKFLDTRDDDEIQLFFAPTYACNFACTYCYQAGYEHKQGRFSTELIDAFYAYVDKAFLGQRKYVTIFGGEPLLPSKHIRDGLQHFVSQAAERDLSIAVVTNGYHLEGALDTLTQARVREVQVTLDGPPDVHDRRRFLHGGGATFEKIATGIDAALSRGIAINLRVVVDRENLPALPALAVIAIEKGWTKNPLFKTQLGRNYELHECQIDSGKLYQRLDMYEDLYALIQEHPQLLEFHRPAFHVARFLFDNGELPEPLFDSCPGTKTEWAFDYTGKIYACTATVGKDGEELGTFYPTVSLDVEQVADWEDRDVLSIDACRDCKVQLICGGGCASVAKNRTGKLKTPDCRPVQELLELGFSMYQPRVD